MNKSFMPLFLAVLVGIIGFNIYLYTSQRKLAFIEIQKVYDSFELKKDLESKFKIVQNHRKRILDSLELELKLIYVSIEKGSNKDEKLISNYNLRKNYYLQQKQQAEQDNDALSKQYDKEILNQLNQYVKDFGKEHRYDYIFGTDGNGSIMYGSERVNISDPLIEYINTKYNGIK